MSRKKLLVAAIDFGTTYSGWAFSFRHDFEVDPTKISAKHWGGGQLISLKAPTCVLVEPNGKTLHSFGYEAENKYVELAEDGDHENWYFFRRFKMLLFGRLGFERNILIKDACDKCLPASRVFSMAIGYLKDDLINVSKSRILDENLRPDEIHWVLTVPAIWNDTAKQFMRECAVAAGIDNDNLTIALEPEAASLYCRHIPMEKNLSSNTCSLASFQAGSKYLVLDAGGGTVDVTVHQVQSDGKLKELRTASGGAWGGTKVDEQFSKFLAKLFGDDVMNTFQEKYMEDYLEIFRDFEIKKRDIRLTKDDKVTFRIPIHLSELLKESMGITLNDRISKTEFADKIQCKVGDKIRVDASIVKEFLRVPIESILDHIERLLGESALSGCEAIVMVGGFAESPMLQEYVRRENKRMKIVIPEDAGLAVLKGAVIYGHEPSAIASRVCKFTYGVKIKLPFDEAEHPASKKVIDGGMAYCDDVFHTHVQVGQTVKYGEAQVEKVYKPARDDQTEVTFQVYASSSPCPRFITDEGCHTLGEFRIEVPKSLNAMNRRVKARMIFGGTEIQIETVNEATGEVSNAKVDYLG